jgi:hypothetical protein
MRTLSIIALFLAAGCDTTIQPIAEGERGPMGQPGECPTWRPRTHIVRDQVEVAPGTWETAMAICDAGSIALNGGCQWGDYLMEGHTFGAVVPYLDTGIGQADHKDAFEGWQCQGENVGEVPTRIYATVVCLEIDTE